MTQQFRHNALQFFYYMAICAMGGFTAVFLQYKGMSNSMIGVVSGLGSFGILFVSPLVNRLMEKIPFLTAKKTLTLSFYCLIISFFLIVAIDIPRIVLSVLFVASNILLVSVLSITTILPMEYIRTGHELNYGVARGYGSISYAISAVVIGRFCQMINPNVLFVFFLISALGVLWSVSGIEDVKVGEKTENLDETKNETSAGMFQLFRIYPLLGKLLIAYLLMFGAAICLGTYLVNIVRALGGNTTIYGVAVFCAAASEMPAMAMVPKLLKRYDRLRLLQIASIGYIMRNVLICLAPNVVVVFLGCMLQGVSYAIFSAVLTYYIADAVAKEDQMNAQSLTIIVSSGIGATIGNLCGGFLQDLFGLHMVFGFVIIMTVLGAIIAISAIQQESYKHTI